VTTAARPDRPAGGLFTWGSWVPRRPGRRAATILMLSYGLGFFLPIIGAIQSLLAAHDGAHAAARTDSIAAELINDAIPLALSLLAATLGMRSAVRAPLWAVLPLMIVMRGAFHVYYGPGALFVIPWMCGAYLLYRRCALLWPFILAHGAYDVLVTLTDNAPHAASITATVIQDTLAILGTLVGVHAVWIHLRTHGLGRGEPEPASAPA
jgi:hypothetical protein